MTSRIRSLLPTAPVVVPLASGRAVRLSPGQVSDELPDAEVADNEKVAKLLGQRVIEVERVGGEQREPEGSEGPGDSEEPEESAEPEASALPESADTSVDDADDTDDTPVRAGPAKPGRKAERD